MGRARPIREQVFAQADPLNLDNDLAEFGRRLATVPLLLRAGHPVALQRRRSTSRRGWSRSCPASRSKTYVQQHIFDPLRHEGHRLDPAGRALSAPRRGLRRRAPTASFSARATRTSADATSADSQADHGRRRARLVARRLHALRPDAAERRQRSTASRILKPSTVKLMATDQLDPRDHRALVASGQGQWRLRLRFRRPHRPAQEREGKSRRGRRVLLGRRLDRPSSGSIRPTSWRSSIFVQSDPFDGTLHHDIRQAVYGDDLPRPEGRLTGSH